MSLNMNSILLLSKLSLEAGKLRGSLEYLKDIEQVDSDSYQRLLTRIDIIEDLIGKLNLSVYDV